MGAKWHKSSSSPESSFSIIPPSAEGQGIIQFFCAHALSSFSNDIARAEEGKKRLRVRATDVFQLNSRASGHRQAPEIEFSHDVR